MFSITSDIVVSGFVSKVVNDCVDVLKSKIKDADKGRESDSQNFENLRKINIRGRISYMMQQKVY